MTNNRVIEKRLSSCCISHHFYQSASKNPSKIAVIHARSGAKFAREFLKFYDDSSDHHASITDSSSSTDKLFDEFIATKLISSHPPMFEGDECLTFSEILAAVDSLSCRLRHILDGGDDPYVVKPISGSFHHVQAVHDHASGGELSTEDQNVYYTPRIVGVYMVPSVEYIISVLSVLRCGEAFMPLDPSWPKERVLSIVSSSKADLIIGCQSSIDGIYHQLDKHVPVLYISIEGNLQERFVSSHLVWPCEKERSRMFCYLMYTSGSTGKPKGVCGTEPGLINRFLWMQELYPLNGEELLLFKTSVSFIDHLQEFLGPLLTTCTLIVPPFNELRENLFSIVNYLQAYSINRLVAVPSLMRAILPALKSPCNIKIQSSLKLLVLSGEILPISLWDTISKLLPKTTILNLYGSTEVSGDCTYFDCKRLPLILETEALSSVPIGLPIPNCEVLLQSEEDSPDGGEIYVGGLCVANGYISYPSIKPLNHSNLPQNSSFSCSTSERASQYYLKTGDFAIKLQSGDLVFIGRKDRTIKINGQRISLEEIESTLREHENIVDAAVICSEGQGEGSVLEAYLVTTQKVDRNERLRSSIRRWLLDKIPMAMIPNHFFFPASFPMSSSGKVDYKLLAGSRRSMPKVCNEREEIQNSELLEVIKQAFCDALKIEKISCDDDFFAFGGDSISAAHASHNLGINMRLLYTFPTPLKLQMALLKEKHPFNHDLKIHADSRPAKYLKLDSCVNSKSLSLSGSYWNFGSVNVPSSFSRCNKVMSKVGYEANNLFLGTRSMEIPRDEKGYLRELWKVHMESCVDASPLVVFKEKDIYLYIGSHSHKFLCIDAKIGSVQWEIKLEGRVECSAAILSDFSQVIVGCYQGNIYFLDSLNGTICWTFRTRGEVKSQPMVDNGRHLVWCGSYDHNLYALDYRNNCCVYKLHCGGSIYGSPVIDEVHNKLYVASTSGHLTAICIKASPFGKMWVQDLGAPVFGSLSINSYNGNVICSLVNGHVLALDPSGSIIWRGITGGPIFAGPCVSHTLPSQVLICSRDGSIYSFELGKGDLLWKHNIGDPIIAAAYVDENLQLVSNLSHLPVRLLCVCASSGSIHLLRINSEIAKEKHFPSKDLVQEFARLDLKGDIFSSPVMIDGRIFIGCRDDYVHCIELEDHFSVQTRI